MSGDRRTLVGPYRDAGDRRVLDFVTTLGTAGDRAGIGRLAHTLKGAAGNLGADRVMAAAEAVAAGLRGQDGGLTIEARIGKLTAELSVLIDGFRRVLEQRQTTADGIGSAGPSATAEKAGQGT